MRDIGFYVQDVAGAPAGDENQPHLRSILQRQREQIADALRRPEVVADIMALARIPGILRGLIAPVVRRALAVVADWIDPRTPTPQ